MNLEPARGHILRNYPETRKIAINFDEDTFETIRAMAAQGGVSFGEQVRTLVEWGLEA
jgi:hypothetical protein